MMKSTYPPPHSFPLHKRGGLAIGTDNAGLDARAAEAVAWSSGR